MGAFTKYASSEGWAFLNTMYLLNNKFTGRCAFFRRLEVKGKVKQFSGVNALRN
ncbi:MAG: hypothetical protein ACTSXH_18315 [Promethearchaeota archaeon]